MASTQLPHSHPLSLPPALAFRIASEPASLAVVRRIARGFLEECLPAPVAADMLLALGEATANAIQHGSPRGAQSSIWIRFTRSPTVLLEVEDEGPGFDLRRLIAVPSLDSDDPPEHGWGCFLMRQVSLVTWEQTRLGMRVRLQPPRQPFRAR